MLNYVVITMRCENMKNDDGGLLYHRFIKKTWTSIIEIVKRRSE